LSAKVGVDQSAAAGSSRVRFEVYGDGKQLAATGWLGLGDPAATLDVAVAGHRIIELVARSEAEPDSPIPVTWGNAALTRDTD
jgi:hypothetical protein